MVVATEQRPPRSSSFSGLLAAARRGRWPPSPHSTKSVVKTLVLSLPRFLALVVFALFCCAMGRTSVSAAGSGGSYVLEPNDVVEIKVFQEDDLDAKLRISQNGTIT